MKRIWFGILISCSTLSWAWGPPDGSLVITSDTRTVSVSTAQASPTQLLTRDSFIQRTWIMNYSSCTLFVSSTSTSVSFATSFQIPAFSTAGPSYFSPDGVNAPFWGALWGASNCQGTSNSSAGIFRTK